LGCSDLLAMEVDAYAHTSRQRKELGLEGGGITETKELCESACRSARRFSQRLCWAFSGQQGCVDDCMKQYPNILVQGPVTRYDDIMVGAGH
jgi:hypothetical protein